MERSGKKTMKRARGRALHACIAPIRSAKSPVAAKGPHESTGQQTEPKQRRAGREPTTDCPCTHRPRLKLVFQCRLWRDGAHGARSGRGNASRQAHADHRVHVVTECSRRCGRGVGGGARTKRRDTGERRACRTGPQTSSRSYKFSHHPPTLQCKKMYDSINAVILRRGSQLLGSRARARTCGGPRGSTPRTSTREAGSTPGTGRMIRWENPLRSVVRRRGRAVPSTPVTNACDLNLI